MNFNLFIIIDQIWSQLEELVIDNKCPIHHFSTFSLSCHEDLQRNTLHVCHSVVWTTHKVEMINTIHNVHDICRHVTRVNFIGIFHWEKIKQEGLDDLEMLRLTRESYLNCGIRWQIGRWFLPMCHIYLLHAHSSSSHIIARDSSHWTFHLRRRQFYDNYSWWDSILWPSDLLCLNKTLYTSLGFQLEFPFVDNHSNWLDGEIFCKFHRNLLLCCLSFLPNNPKEHDVEI